MKFCTIIPSYNHSEKLEEIVAALLSDTPAIVVDDGSNPPLPEIAGARILRRAKNGGKAAALLDGFAFARELGFTHAVVVDADGQHPPSLVPKFVEKARANPSAIVVGCRDFENSAIPPARKFLNKFSNFWFRAETGVDVPDTQCGFRCYPLSAVFALDLNVGGFVFEVELLVKAAWAEIQIELVQIPALYDARTLAKSHYRPFADTMKFTAMNTRLYFQSLFLPKRILKKIALKK